MERERERAPHIKGDTKGPDAVSAFRIRRRAGNTEGCFSDVLIAGY